MASTKTAGTPVLPETAVGKGFMVNAEGWTPTALAMVDCTAGVADDPETTTGGRSATATTGVTGIGLELEATPASSEEELEATEIAVVDVSLKVAATATEA